ncbi:MAG: hypothetical protein AAF902_11020 [Chloroflexota bacterium]
MLAAIYISLGSFYIRLGDFEKGELYLNASQNVSKELIADFSENQFSNSFPKDLQVDIEKDLGWIKVIYCSLFFCFGDLYQSLGKMDDSELVILEGIRLIDDLKPSYPWDKWILGGLLLFRSFNHLQQGDFYGAQAILEDGINLARTLYSSRGLALFLSQLGFVLLSTGQLDYAEECLLEALSVSSEIDDVWGTVRIHNLLGKLYLAKKPPQKGINFLQNSIKVAINKNTVSSDALEAISELAQYFYVNNHQKQKNLRILKMVNRHDSTLNHTKQNVNKIISRVDQENLNLMPAITFHEAAVYYLDGAFEQVGSSP